MHGSHQQLVLPVGAALIFVVRQRCLWLAGAIRPTKWLKRPECHARDWNAGHGRPLVLRSGASRTPRTRWLDSNPGPTATPNAIDALAAWPCRIEPQPPEKATRRVYRRLAILSLICKREESMSARCHTRNGHVVDRCSSGGFSSPGTTLIDRIDAICRRFHPIAVSLRPMVAQNKPPSRSDARELARPMLDH